MKFKLPELRQMLIDNNLKGISRNKTEIIELLINKGYLKKEDVYPEQRIVEKKVIEKEIKKPIDPKYERLRNLRTQPKKVVYTDLETGNVQEFDSVYKAARATKHSSKLFTDYNGRLYKERYQITVM